MFEISPLRPVAAAHELAALHRQCFPDAWDAAAIRALLVTPGAFGYAHADGFVLARAAAGEAEILTLAVAPAARGQGLGRALLRAAIEKAQTMGAQTMFLEVGADNPSALALYAGLGFAKAGVRKGYYARDCGATDALVLRLPLPVKFP